MIYSILGWYTIVFMSLLVMACRENSIMIFIVFPALVFSIMAINRKGSASNGKRKS